MNHTPGTQIPNFSNYQPDIELLKLRRRVGDLLRLGAATPDTYLQTIMQLFQEAERRRQSNMAEAEDCLRRHHALVAQAQGFASMSSILFSIVNGFASLEERRLLETAERAKEQQEKEEAVKASNNGPETNGHSTQEAGVPETAPVMALPPPPPKKPSGGKRRKP